MQVSKGAPERRYSAFISYRHDDNREEGRHWAEWLHQALETYEVPRDLVGRVNGRGEQIPASLYPVFRDEVELPADADLSQPIRHALRNSGTLIVLCSPRASHSRFVADEIRYFKELGKADRILALIINGEPNADDPTKAAAHITPEMECFPEPLRYGATGKDGTIDWKVRTEPIAPDVRPQNYPNQGYTTAAAYRSALQKNRSISGSEFRRLERAFAEQLDLARLKLISGILAVSLDQLVQRDAKYRARKLRRAAAVLGVLLIASISAGLFVWDQRNKAEAARAVTEISRKKAVTSAEQAKHAREEADKLIHFMLFDLTKRLESIGKGDLLEEVRNRSRAYFAAFSEYEGARSPQRDQAVALLREGDWHLEEHDCDGALLAFREAASILRKLADGSPNGWHEQLDLATCWNRIGETMSVQGDTASALRMFSQLKTNLEAGLPKLAQTSAPPGGVERIWMHAWAVNSRDLALTLQEHGETADAVRVLDEARPVFEKLAASDPEDAQLQFDWTGSTSSEALLLSQSGMAKQALSVARETMPRLARLAAQYPENAKRKADLAESYYTLALAFSQATDKPPNDAILAAQESVNLRRWLAERDEGNQHRKRDLAESYKMLGLVLHEREEDTEAMKANQAARLNGFTDWGDGTTLAAHIHAYAALGPKNTSGLDGIMELNDIGWLGGGSTGRFAAGDVWWVLFGGRWDQNAQSGSQAVLHCWNDYWSLGKGAGLSDTFCQNCSPGTLPNQDVVAYVTYLLTGQAALPFSGITCPRWTLNDGAP